MTSRLSRLAVITAALAFASSCPVPAAHAGTYEVYGCGGSGYDAWFDSGNSSLVGIGAGPCSVGPRGQGADPAPLDAWAHWEFRAPAGTSITGVRFNYELTQGDNWVAGLMEPNQWLLGGPNCAGGVCFSKGHWQSGVPNVSSLYVHMACAATPCPQNSGSRIKVWDAFVTVYDPTRPNLGGVRGDLWTDAWQSGRRSIAFEASDNTGIEVARVLIGGRLVGELKGTCSSEWSTCGDFTGSDGASMSITTTDAPSDGRHALAVQAIDKGGNVAQANRIVLIDNTAPAAPEDVHAIGGHAWRNVNSFDVAWTNPSQAGRAPIVGAAYRLCPVKSTNGSCEDHVVRGQDLTSIRALKLPRAGEWTFRLRLIDAAGNSRDEMASRPLTLGWDEDAPEITFPPLSSDDPTRVFIQGSDRTSPLARGELEMRREGTKTWHTMRGEPAAVGFEARIADEELPNGRYEMRVRVADSAGNERSTDRLTTGEPAQVKLPVRTIARLVAGRKGRRSCRGRGETRRCRTRLVARPGVRYRSRVTLLGRLTLPKRQPVAGTNIEVWEQTELKGAPWRRLSTVRTSRTGRFRFRAPAGPARTIRFRYPGTRLIRPENAEVALRVRASTTLRVSDHRVVNGEYVTFRGRVRGRPLPASGKLVELQAYAGGAWRTFAQPRASAKGGRWAYRYRFQATRGRVRYRFRARVRQEADFPFHTGTSRRVQVTVLGL
jgi:hypothetical protein